MEPERPTDEESPSRSAPTSPSNPENGSHAVNGKNAPRSASADEYQRLVRLALQQSGANVDAESTPEAVNMVPGMRVTEIHEAYQENVRRMEFRMRLMTAARYLAFLPVLAVVVYLGLGWRNLNRGVFEAREELKQVGGILDDRTTRLRAQVPVGDPMPGERKLSSQITQSQVMVQSDQVEVQVKGIRQWNAALTTLTQEAKRRAQRTTPEAYAELSGTLQALRIREREYLRRYNRAVDSYNKQALEPPQTFVRSIGRFPSRLPFYVSNE